MQMVKAMHMRKANMIKEFRAFFNHKYTMDVIHLQANVDDGKCT